jgi:iron(III) transport system ATP-binding protein
MAALHTIKKTRWPMKPLIELRGIQKAYGPLTVLNGIDLQVAAGSRTVIVGPSGSGKTTLLRILAGFEAPDRGELIVGGRVLAGAAHKAVPAHLRGIGFVPQEGALFPHLNIADNIGFGIPRNIPDRENRVNELMDMVSLSHTMRDLRPHELSGGQQQRVALARALAQRPKLMLLDEPFSALDTGLRATTRKAIGDLLDAAGITTILVTHDQAEALSFADQIAVMRGGQFAQVGVPRDVYLSPVDPQTAHFLGAAIIVPATVANGIADCALGKIAIADYTIRGRQNIMLRPEQIQLAKIADTDTGHDGGKYVGVITDLNFTGSTYGLTVRLEPDPGNQAQAALSLQVPVLSLHELTAQTKVSISVTGTAHVFKSAGA